MRPAQLTQVLAVLLKQGRNVMLEGSPGVGKTELAKAVVASLGPKWRVVFKHVPSMQPEDLACPRVDGERLAFSRADWIPLEGDYADDEHVVVVFDELAAGDNAVQKTIANLIQERESYGVPLHRNVAFICTGNRQSDRAGANRLLSHLRNRMTTIPFDASLDDWCNWALAHDVTPELVSFLRFKPNLLNDFDPKRDLNPTPRAWAERVDQTLKSLTAGELPQSAELELIAGDVGEGAAAELTAFLRIYRKLPSPDAVLMQPDTHPIPDEASVRYALSGAIAHRATPDNFDAVVTFAQRMPKEFSVMIILDAMRKNPDVQQTKAFIRWASTDGAAVLL